MNERERQELRRSMQPASQSPPDASVASIAGGMFLAAFLIFLLALCIVVWSYGGRQRPHDFDHRFLVLDAAGLIVESSVFVFTMNRDDFDAHWSSTELDSEGRVVGEALSQLFRVERRNIDAEICWSETFVFMWADSFEVAAEIPAGTCLANDGETQVVLR